MSLHDGKKESHPSWGMIVFHRITGGRGWRLFGSPLRSHDSCVRLTIRPGHRQHDLAQDWLSAENRVLAEVDLSESQFARLITTMNVGEGVPCTLRFIDGEQLPEPPDDPMETERVRESFAADAEGILRHLRELIVEADKALGKRELLVGDREDLRKRLRHIRQEITSNLPFVLEQFEQATDKITTAAKAEVDAFVTGVAQHLGVKRLRDLARGLPSYADPTPDDPELPPKEDPR